MARLNKKGLIDTISSFIQVADYSSDKIIEGVKFISLVNYPADDGDLSEIFRITQSGAIESFSDFKIAQLNRIRHNTGAVKAWHIHLNQDEIWYISPYDHLFVGLWDVRKKSQTANLTMRIILGGAVSSLLFIPKEVAHGSANFTERPVDLYSMANNHFNPQKPDEIRVPWDAIGKQFWEPLKD